MKTIHRTLISLCVLLAVFSLGIAPVAASEETMSAGDSGTSADTLVKSPWIIYSDYNSNFGGGVGIAITFYETDGIRFNSKVIYDTDWELYPEWA